MKAFELFIQGDKIKGNDWEKITEKIELFDKKYLIEVNFSSSNIEFFVYSSKDLSYLNTEEKRFLFKPVYRPLAKRSDMEFQKIHFHIPANKSILEIQEFEAIKKQRQIKKLIIRFSQFLGIRFYSVKIILKDNRNNYFLSNFVSLTSLFPNLEFDFNKSVRIKKKSAPLFLKIDGVRELFTDDSKHGFLEVFGFPYYSHSIYFPLSNFEINKHTLIVGQTGVGKSKFIELFIKEINRSRFSDEYQIVIIDPHATLYRQFAPVEKKINIDFIHSLCNLFPSVSEPKIAVELTILLFKTLMADQFNAKMERVLKYVTYTLFLTNKMSLYSLKQFLTELSFRKEVLTELDDSFDYLNHFFDTEFIEILTKHYEVAVMPVLVLIDEINFIPVFRTESSQTLESILENNFLTCISLNRIFLGDKATRLIAGLIIEQLFLIAQKRAGNKKIILMIDEVSLVENESLISILSEARKFNLSLFLSQQYLTQISPSLLKATLSNVYNYFVFKVADEDAEIMGRNLRMEFPEEILKTEKEKGLKEENLKSDLLVNLNPQECLVRVFSGSKFHPCFKAKTRQV